ncbi:hypothetical protein DL89DRAFT_264434 [Linderina pennispora]|uniref:ATPase AAA-type core domain-containing protein n=1 Tax=Linderina pennispora TaxID=61395 RepID=A0A1Y1WM89_9FUNG|nr:uncharacterized protein DL89DRAFT_264434 [Linderina pennispora]ORX74602.1 hypothetical protein DL89DRAFT_264434 [Linderina pennispora]
MGAVPEADNNTPAQPAAPVHPFFMSRSAKRTQTQTATGDATAKRSKPVVVEKRGRKPNSLAQPKPGKKKQQTLLGLKPAAKDTAPEQQIDKAGTDTSNDDGPASVPAVEPKPFASINSEADLRKLDRMAARAQGTPAPYPTVESSHVPTPKFLPYIANHAVRVPDATARGIQSAEPLPDSAWRSLVGSLLSPHAARQVHNPLHIPVRATFGIALPKLPAHALHCAPLLRALVNESVSNPAVQLLASRYHPRKAREVLGNNRAVGLLHSWIDSMRLKHSSANAADVGKQSAGRLASVRGRHARPSRTRRRILDTDDSDSLLDGSNDGFDDDDDDDDFMPTPKPRRRGRAAGNDKELNDILAWANSDGTLSSVREKRRAVWRSGSDTEPETFSNIILLEGPSGSCKTAAVYACADDLGFQVHEIHPGQKRSGKDILSALEDLIQSHTISAPSNLPYYSQPGASSAGSNTMSTENQMLILIEQVDVLFEQDQRMWPALKQLAHKSRRPIVLTCTDTSCVRWGASNFHSVLSFRRPTEDILVPYCFLLCLIEGALVSPAELSQVCRESECNINRMLSVLELAICEARSRQNLEENSPPRDIDLSGTLAWLFRPLEAGETSSTCYNFWRELVVSAQPATPEWFRLWPDLPPDPVRVDYDTGSESRPPQRLGSLFKRPLSAHQNTFFSKPAPTIEPHADKCPNPTLVCRTVIPVSLHITPNIPADQPESDDSTPPTNQDPSAEQAQLDRLADSLDMLSLASATVGMTQTDHELQLEQTFGAANPMLDECLGVYYVKLDSDVLSRQSPACLLDSPTDECCAGENAIYRWLTSAEVKRSGITDVSQSMSPNSFRSELTAHDHKRSGVLQDLCCALDLIGHRRERTPSMSLQDTAAYLAYMVTWDSVHQGKIEAPARAQTTYAPFGEEALSRIGIRRTRMNTYRAHIKRVPAPMQTLLINWATFPSPT